MFALPLADAVAVVNDDAAQPDRGRELAERLQVVGRGCLGGKRR